MKTLYTLAIKHCCTKQPGQYAPSSATATNPELPSLKDVEELITETSEEQPVSVTEHTMPILCETADEQVIMTQPKHTIDAFFPKTRSYTEQVEQLPKLTEVPAAADHETQLNYSGIPYVKTVSRDIRTREKAKKR